MTLGNYIIANIYINFNLFLYYFIIKYDISVLVLNCEVVSAGNAVYASKQEVFRTKALNWLIKKAGQRKRGSFLWQTADRRVGRLFRRRGGSGRSSLREGLYLGC